MSYSRYGQNDRKVQRTAFRTVLATLEEGEMPTESFKLRRAEVHGIAHTMSLIRVLLG